MRDGLVIEAGGDSVIRFIEGVVGEVSGEESLACDGDSDSGGVAGDPASAPLFGDESGSA